MEAFVGELKQPNRKGSFALLLLFFVLALMFANVAVGQFTGSLHFLKTRSAAIQVSIAAIIVGICLLIADLLYRFREKAELASPFQSDNRPRFLTFWSVISLLTILAIIELAFWISASWLFNQPLIGWFSEPFWQLWAGYSLLSALPGTAIGAFHFQSRFTGILVGVSTSAVSSLPFLNFLALAYS